MIPGETPTVAVKDVEGVNGHGGKFPSGQGVLLIQESRAAQQAHSGFQWLLTAAEAVRPIDNDKRWPKGEISPRRP